METMASIKWRMKYRDRLIARGLGKRFATVCSKAAEMEGDPADAADDELSYMADDSDIGGKVLVTL